MDKPAEDAKLVRLDLSPEQMRQLRLATGLDVKAIELSIEELEQRVAPRVAPSHDENPLTP
jgi:hypothetical protein